MTILSIRGKPIDPAISLIIFFFSALIVGVIPFLYHDTAAQNFPDEETLLSFFGADLCQLTSTTIEERNSYACSAFLLESAGLSAKTAPIAGAFLSVTLTVIPILQFSRIPLAYFSSRSAGDSSGPFSFRCFPRTCCRPAWCCFR